MSRRYWRQVVTLYQLYKMETCILPLGYLLFFVKRLCQ